MKVRGYGQTDVSLDPFCQDLPRLMAAVFDIDIAVSQARQIPAYYPNAGKGRHT